MSLVAALLVAGIGMLIGIVGLGGFLLVPVLMVLEGVPVRDAVVVAAVAFLCSGLLSLLLWRRRSPGEVRSYRAFLVAAAPGAAIGALVVGALADGALTLVIAAAFAVAGVAEWLGLPRDKPARPLTGAQAAAGGASTGFASALTGTSGPMVAMPLLAWSGVPMRERISVGQVAQVPIALGATVMFVTFGAVPWRLAALCSAALCVGLLASALVAPWMRPGWLHRLAATLMLGAAATLLARH